MGGVTDGGGNGPRPELIGTFDQLRAELARLRVRAGRGRGKAALSLRDIASTSGVPRTTLANYLSGASVIPADQLDAVVLALGATPAETAQWAAAWERAMDHRLATVRSDDPAEAENPTDRTTTVRRWRTGVALVATAVTVAAGAVAVDRLLLDPAPVAQTRAIESRRPATAPLCWPVSGDWDGDGRTTAAVACKDGIGLPWIGTNVPGGGPPQYFGGYGNSEYCLPTTGDWDGDGGTTVGVACRIGADLRWSQINSLAGGSPSYPRFLFGTADACWPVTGDWDGDGRTTVGAACRNGDNIRWHLRDSLSGGDPSVPPFEFGQTSSCWPVAGDWDGDGRTTVGAACRDGPNLRWSLTNSVAGGGPSYPPFTFGSSGSCRAVTGDWNGDRVTTVGVACYTDDGIRWHLTDSPGGAGPSANPPFVLGDAGTFQPSDGWRGPPWPHQ